MGEGWGRGQGDADPGKFETREEKRERGRIKEEDRSEKDETVHFKISFCGLLKEKKKAPPAYLCS